MDRSSLALIYSKFYVERHYQMWNGENEFLFFFLLNKIENKVVFKHS